jgi:broad specificity phosphatase PhoE
LPARVKRMTATLDALYVSPIERAIDTAAGIAAGFGIAPQLCPAVAEIDVGRWTGASFRELDADPEWTHFNSMRSTAACPGGERAVDVQTRAVSALNEIAAAHPGGTVAIVSHAEVIRSAVLHIARLSVDDYSRVEISPASISIVRVGGGAEIVLINDPDDSDSP